MTSTCSPEVSLGAATASSDVEAKAAAGGGCCSVSAGGWRRVLE